MKQRSSLALLLEQTSPETLHFQIIFSHSGAWRSLGRQSPRMQLAVCHTNETIACCVLQQWTAMTKCQLQLLRCSSGQLHRRNWSFPMLGQAVLKMVCNAYLNHTMVGLEPPSGVVSR